MHNIFVQSGDEYAVEKCFYLMKLFSNFYQMGSDQIYLKIRQLANIPIEANKDTIFFEFGLNSIKVKFLCGSIHFYH